MKHLIYLLAFFSLNLVAQSKYITKTGVVNFEASVASFEEVKAMNQSVTAIIETKSGAFAALVLVKGFRFKNALMEEHFNENYAESDQFPKATFKGNLEDFSIDKLSATSIFKMNGSLTFHGKTKKLESIPLKLSREGDFINVSGSFLLNTSDFDIKIPKVVKDKVSETVEVSLNFKLKKT
ncbi:YceI family protein [Mariniflexile sp. AS56]|uniref:YceI family protein n=1 Tax=Mariniflexile sp. AS56 TaxID=3063957 RepID=UPI0026EEB535|nr:YceI family protein [Mariniflexile sp. AS56]MDO7170640.1 YceI family protein [Mariniflexile sp. AS56]